MRASRNEIFDIFTLPEEKCSTALKCFFDRHGACEFMAQLGEAFRNALNPAIVTKVVNFVHTYFPQSPRPPKTIGVFFNNIRIGGVQRVIISQFPVFKELGMNIVFFTGAQNDVEYPTPDYVKVVRIPIPIPNPAKKEFRQSLQSCIEKIRDENIDILYSHDIYGMSNMLWIPLISKTKKELNQSQAAYRAACEAAKKATVKVSVEKPRKTQCFCQKRSGFTGTAIWFLQKICGGLQCLQDNGLSYTCRCLS